MLRFDNSLYVQHDSPLLPGKDVHALPYIALVVLDLRLYFLEVSFVLLADVTSQGHLPFIARDLVSASIGPEILLL